MRLCRLALLYTVVASLAVTFFSSRVCGLRHVRHHLTSNQRQRLDSSPQGEASPDSDFPFVQESLLQSVQHHTLKNDGGSSASPNERPAASFALVKQKRQTTHFDLPALRCYWIGKVVESPVLSEVVLKAGSPLQGMTECQMLCRDTHRCTHYIYNTVSKVCTARGGEKPTNFSKFGESEDVVTATKDCELYGDGDYRCYQVRLVSTNPTFFTKTADGPTACQTQCRLFNEHVPRPPKRCTHVSYEFESKACHLKVNGKPEWTRNGGPAQVTVLLDECELPSDSLEVLREKDKPNTQCAFPGMGSDTRITKSGAVEGGPEACQKWCKEEWDCIFFTFVSESKICHLRRGFSSNLVARPGETTYERECDLSSSEVNPSLGPPSPPLPEEVTPSSPPLPEEVTPSSPPLPEEVTPSSPPLPEEVTPPSPPLPEEVTPSSPPLPEEVTPPSPPLSEEMTPPSASLPYPSQSTEDAAEEDCLKHDLGSETQNIKQLHIGGAGSARLSAKACHDECVSMTACTHITYNSDSGICYLKSGTPAWRPYTNDTSATRECYIPLD
ncbi:pan domain-containing protein [Cystoisospora suis]|uniref:Pan domain-containing protein n=1 Tax=Cystoisospora suis TaxID=483139 RepID=A0A2C6KD09_9APIC|nr:pan domain-containing protein [Cystoisospora suis]